MDPLKDHMHITSLTSATFYQEYGFNAQWSEQYSTDGREMPFGLSCIAFQKEKAVAPVHTNYYYLHYTFFFTVSHYNYSQYSKGPTLHHFTPSETGLMCLVWDDCCSALFNNVTVISLFVCFS